MAPKILVFVLALVCGYCHQTWGASSVDYGVIAAKYALAGDFKRASIAAKRSTNPALIDDLVLFIKISQKTEKDLKITTNFIKRHPLILHAFPNVFDTLLSINTPLEQTQHFVNALQRKTPLNQIILCNAVLQKGSIREKPQEFAKLVKLWSTHEFSPALENYFFQTYGKHLHSDAIEKKLTLLIFNNSKIEKTALIRALPLQKRNFYQNAMSASQSIKAAKNFYYENIKSNQNKMLPHYLYAKQLLKADNQKALSSILITANYQEFALQWWKIKNVTIRNALRDKHYHLALKLALSNQIKEGPDYFESEWLAGFVLCQMLNKPKAALVHFHNMLKTASLSHSIAQSAYWLGRAYNKLGDKNNANFWFNFAISKYSHYFYGQLASLELSQSLQYNATKARTPKNTNTYSAKAINSAISWANILYHIGMKTESNQIIQYVASLNLDTQYATDIANKIKRSNNYPLLILFAKYLANNGHPLSMASYPNHINFNTTNHQNTSLYLAIIRQESGFDHKARSSAGAYGLMQLMPNTASQLAKELQLKRVNCLKDTSVNIKLGTFYLDKLMSFWDNSYVMTAASYNAGESAVKKWVSHYGDPRAFKDLHAVIDWIELIPYPETRLYVKKIIENMINYDVALFRKKQHPARIRSYFQSTALKHAF